MKKEKVRIPDLKAEKKNGHSVSDSLLLFVCILVAVLLLLCFYAFICYFNQNLVSHLLFQSKFSQSM